jgi:hypothetical protein
MMVRLLDLPVGPNTPERQATKHFTRGCTPRLARYNRYTRVQFFGTVRECLPVGQQCLAGGR